MKKTFDPTQPLHPKPAQKEIGLKDLMPQSHIALKLKATKRHEVLSEMADLALSQGVAKDKNTLLIGLAEREKMLSTAQPGGIAFLHTRRRSATLVKKSALFLGISKKGILFEAPDDKPTHLFYLLLLQTDEEHLRALSLITRACRNPEFNQSILKANSVEEILALLPN